MINMITTMMMRRIVVVKTISLYLLLFCNDFIVNSLVDGSMMANNTYSTAVVWQARAIHQNNNTKYNEKKQLQSIGFIIKTMKLNNLYKIFKIYYILKMRLNFAKGVDHRTRNSFKIQMLNK